MINHKPCRSLKQESCAIFFKKYFCLALKNDVFNEKLLLLYLVAQRYNCGLYSYGLGFESSPFHREREDGIKSLIDIQVSSRNRGRQ
jgi:hypothetical protein